MRKKAISRVKSKSPAQGFDMPTKGAKIGPCILSGQFVRLEPLRKRHVAELYKSARRLDWSLLLGQLRSKEDVERRIENGLEAEKSDSEYAFAVTLIQQDKVVGSTAYLSVNSKHKRVEIGSTWYTPDQWGTAVNPECKFLLLRHAFEDWGAVRVQFGTDIRNMHSRRAILKLGAKFEGILRNHGILPDGRVRDAVLYSIIPSEWSEAKAKLLARIRAFQDQPSVDKTSDV
ncbi:MAG: GNAT family N-acetyltransferase [Thaumarchaeota archaeon]|nr:MAG: GNAT family N-acetyltransferase [Nitrososphaerota archaeon]